MLIGTVAVAKLDWTFLKFYILQPDSEDDFELPKVFRDGLPDTFPVEKSEIAIETKIVAIVEDYPWADELYLWLSDHTKGRFQIPVGYRSHIDDPLAYGIFFEHVEDVDIYTTYLLSELDNDS